MISIKFSYFFNTFILLFLSNCSHSTNVELRNLQHEREFSAPVASPINPDILKNNRHLESYKDQLLLSNDLVQLVVSGIPGSPTQQHLQAIILDMYVKKHGKWTRYSKNLPIWLSFKNDDEKKDAWFPIGFELINKKKFSSIKFTWATNDSSKKIVTRLSVKNDLPLASFSIEGNTPSNGSCILMRTFNTILHFLTIKLRH